MNDIHTRYARIDELLLTTAEQWLSPLELAAWQDMRSKQRRRSWLAGRVLAKRLLHDVLAIANESLAGLPPTAIHLESRSARAGHGERPVAYFCGRPAATSISLAHTDVGVLVAVCLSGERKLGVDLVQPTATSTTLEWTFTDAELDWLRDRGPHAAERLWAMKEALYKACQRGEGFAPRSIEVVPGQSPRYPDFDAAKNLVALQCWTVDGQIAALAAARLTAQQGLMPQPMTTSIHAA